jgi:geranylgeranyl pyrophosphate synthase
LAIISIEIKSSLRQTVKRLLLASGKMLRSLLFVINRKAAALEAACERTNP